MGPRKNLKPSHPSNPNCPPAEMSSHASEYLVLMPNPLKGYSFEQTLFAIQAHNGTRTRFVFGVTTDDHYVEFRGTPHAINSQAHPESGLSHPSIPVDSYEYPTGSFVLKVDNARRDTWQTDLVEILKTISREYGADYYEPQFSDESLERGPINVLTLDDYPYGCHSGGRQTSTEPRAAAAEEVEPEAEADITCYTFIPSPCCVASPLRILNAIAQVSQGAEPTPYKALAGILGDDGILYTLDIDTLKLQVSPEQYHDIVPALPLAPNSSRHMWFVFHCEPELSVPCFTTIYDTLVKNCQFILPEGASPNADLYLPERAHYMCYKSYDGTVFYIPTHYAPYSHILEKLPRPCLAPL
jgi:hypothetical protein